jgi:putative transposase
VVEKIRRESGKSIRWVCERLSINRITYYRKVFGRRKTKGNDLKVDMIVISPALREIAEANPNLGYRRVWAKAKVMGYNKSKSSAYLDLRRAGLILPKPSYKELKANFEARKSYLVKPDGINQLYQSDFTQLHIPGYRVQYILLVMDYFSRYLLTLKLYPAMTADVFIDGLERALEEAMKLSTFDLGQVITLVTDNGPAMIAKKTARYVEMSPFYHVRGRSHHPQTQGMVERLIRTIKEEEIYLNEYRDPLDAQQKLEKFRLDYNHVRPHQSLKYKTPYEVYIGNEYKSPDTMKMGT